MGVCNPREDGRVLFTRTSLFASQAEYASYTTYPIIACARSSPPPRKVGARAVAHGRSLRRLFRSEAAQLLAQGPQPLARLPVVGLVFGSRLASAVEVASRDAFEVGGDRQPLRRRRAFFHGAHRVAEGLADHLGVHQGRGVQGVRGDARPFQALAEREGEHDLGELALRVGPPPV